MKIRDKNGRKYTISNNFEIIWPARIEALRLTLQFRGSSLTSEQKDLIRDFMNIYIEKDDTLKIQYVFNLEYYGKVAQNLKYILGLFDCAEILEAHTEELLYGKSLLQEILLKIEQLEQKLKGAKK